MFTAKKVTAFWHYTFFGIYIFFWQYIQVYLDSTYMTLSTLTAVFSRMTNQLHNAILPKDRGMFQLSNDANSLHVKFTILELSAVEVLRVVYVISRYTLSLIH